jgi:hypothetical protein
MTGYRRTLGRIKLTRPYDSDPDLSWLDDPSKYEGCTPDEIAKYHAEDLERLASHGSDWFSVGIVATVEVTFRNERDCIVNGYQISSGGLWGFESDSDEFEFDAVGADEVAELINLLQADGFSEDEIAAASDAVEWD